LYLLVHWFFCILKNIVLFFYNYFIILLVKRIGVLWKYKKKKNKWPF
jgi:hypothetical protein